MPGQTKNLVFSMQCVIRRLVRACIWTAVAGGAVVAFDYLYGELSGISSVRRDAQQFRSEATVLRTSTRTMVANLAHEYAEPYRPEGDALVAGGAPRRLKTTKTGTVATGAEPSHTGPHILFLGGSTTECNEVDERYRFPAVVERSLRESGTAATTMNAGVRGHTTLDAINTLLNRPDLARADVIVLMENINDRLRLAIRGGYGAQLNDAAPTSLSAVRESAAATVRALWEYIAYRSNVLFLMQNLKERFGSPPGVAGGWVTERTLDELPLPSSKAQALYAQNVRLFVSIVRTLGKTPVLMTQPLGRHSKAQALFNDQVRAVAQETSTKLIDLDALMPSDRGWAFFDDQIHMNNRGALAVGQMIAESVAPLVGGNYMAPAVETGLTKLSVLADICAPATAALPSAIPKLHQVVGESGRYASVSADGNWLLFQSRVGSLDRIRALRLADHQLIDLSPPELTTDERHPAFLDVSTEGFTVVFGSGSTEGDRKRERLSYRSWPSGHAGYLYGDAELSGSIPNVAGRSVYFAGSKDAEGSRAPNIYRFDRDTAQVHRLTSAPVEQWRPFATRSGDIYFISNPSGRFAIYRRDGRSGHVSVVVSSRVDEWDPAVSPDGKWLAFASKRHGTWDVFVTPTDDLHSVRRLTDLPGDEWDPSWHPSGRILLFGSAQSREPKIVAVCPFGELPSKH